MSASRWAALGAAAGLLLAAAFLAIDRNGLLAWLGVGLGVFLLIKCLRRPSPRDAMLAVTVIGVWAACWGAAWKYVESTWESGEVVQLEIEGAHTARVWVLDGSDGPLMYYDAPPEAASRLLAGAPISMTRNGQLRQACAAATRVDALPKERYDALLDQMLEKYEGLNTATNVFYVVLGGKRDRVGVLVGLGPCGASG